MKHKTLKILLKNFNMFFWTPFSICERNSIFQNIEKLYLERLNYFET